MLFRWVTYIFQQDIYTHWQLFKDFLHLCIFVQCLQSHTVSTCLHGVAKQTSGYCTMLLPQSNVAYCTTRTVL